MPGLAVSVFLVCAVAFIALALLWPAFAQGKFDKFLEKRPKKGHPWDEGYKDMAYAMTKHVRGRSLGPDSYERVKRRVTVKTHVLNFLASDPDMIASFDPAMGRSASRYINGTKEQWNSYLAGGWKFLNELDEYQGLLLSRQASAVDGDERYKKAKAQIDKIRQETYGMVDEHEKFMKELEG